MGYCQKKAEQKIFYSKVVADKRDLTKHSIPVLNRVGAAEFIELLEKNLLRIEQEVKFVVDTFLPEKEKTA